MLHVNLRLGVHTLSVFGEMVLVMLGFVGYAL